MSRMTIELYGLSLHGHHGADADERRKGQRFLFDLWLDVDELPGRTDRIEDAVDYREVAELVQEVSGSHEFHLLETLAVSIADGILTRFPAVSHARVRVRKPEVRLEPPVDYSAVTVERP